MLVNQRPCQKKLLIKTGKLSGIFFNTIVTKQNENFRPPKCEKTG